MALAFDQLGATIVVAVLGTLFVALITNGNVFKHVAWVVLIVMIFGFLGFKFGIQFLTIIGGRRLSDSHAFGSAILNAVMAAALCVLLLAIGTWGDIFEHKRWLATVAIVCGFLGFFYGEPFIHLLWNRFL